MIPQGCAAVSADHLQLLGRDGETLAPVRRDQHGVLDAHAGDDRATAANTIWIEVASATEAQVGLKPLLADGDYPYHVAFAPGRYACGLPLVLLAQARFQLARCIALHVGDLRDPAATRQFRQLVLQNGPAGAWLLESDWLHPHVFEPGRYPAPVASRYSGRYQFPKHYCPVLADLKEDGQEFACAQLIDRHPKVRHWVRNLDTAPCGFALPTSKGRFFPDFVAELMDGRVAVLGFKGAHLLNDPYEIEKRLVGERWGQTSNGRAVFAWLTQTRDGLTTAAQLDRALA